MRLQTASKNSAFEASKSVSTKTLLLKHYYRLQGLFAFCTTEAKAKYNLQICICNHFHADGISPLILLECSLCLPCGGAHDVVYIGSGHVIHQVAPKLQRIRTTSESSTSREKKTNKHKQLRGIVPEMGGGQIAYVFPFFPTHKQNSQEISGKGRESPRTVPG